MSSERHVIIIGGGIVGVSTAYYLARRGCRVTVLERDEIDAGASTGNAGIIALGHPPMPKPGLIGQTLKMLFTKTNPLYIAPRPSMELVRWLMGFRRACRPVHYERSMSALTALGWAAGACFDDIVREEGIGEEVEHHKFGWREAFRTERAFAHGREAAEGIRRYGYAVEVIGGGEVTEHDEAFTEDVIGVITYPDSAFAHPRKFMLELARCAAARGADIRLNCEVHRIHPHNGRFARVTLGTGEEVEGTELVLAAGSWTTELARQLGVRVPMQPGKGYHVELTKPEPCPRTTTVCAETFVAVTPIGGGLRLAGTVELSGLNLNMVQKRVDMLRRGARLYFRDIDRQTVKSRWCGLRPCTADGLPVIGRTREFENVFVGTGHAMMGFALGPVTGKLLSQEILDGEAEMDIAAMSPGRFGG